MRNRIYKSSIILWWVFVIVIFTIFIYSLAGCEARPAPPLPPEPVTQAQTAIIRLMDVNWQVALGSVLSVIGVFILLNGSSKGVAFVGAGLAAIALAGITVTYLQWLVDYGKYIIMLLGGGIVIGFIYFLRTAADFDGDGNVDWDDIKFLFRKIGRPVKISEVEP